MAGPSEGSSTGERRPAIPWAQIGEEWRARRYAAARGAVHALGGSTVDTVDALLFAPESPTRDAALRDVEKAFAHAGETPGGDLLLALYLYGRCLEKWEKTEDYDRIGLILDALDVVTRAATPHDDAANGDTQLLSILGGQAQLLRTAMGVEDALSCSCPVATGDRARSLVTGLDGLLEQELALGDGPDELRAIIRSDATASRRYFDTIGEVADGVLEFVQLDARGREDFDFGHVLRTLRAAEHADDIRGDVYESELRAHRFALEALSEHAREPHLLVDDAEVTYLYPFALRGRTTTLDPATTVALALGDAFAERLTDSGIGPASVRELDLNDLWDAGGGESLGDGTQDPRDDEPSYSGVSIELPPIKVTTTAAEEVDFTAEVRLSRLGNHHLLVRSELEGARLHEVNQSLRRGSHGMGEETFEGLEWTTFPRYAEAVTGMIASALEAERVLNPKAPYHVVLAARSISVEQTADSTPRASLSQLKRAVGASLLFHPVRHLTTSLEEWIRYPPPTVDNLLEGQGYAGDLVARTDNTTVAYMPASPEWLIDEYIEMIEFVSSVPPLLTLWERRAADLDLELKTSLQDHDVSVETLYDQEVKIRELEHEVRAQLAFLRSPALCRTRGQRRFLDALWEAAGLPRLEEELERRLTALAERQERIATMLRRRQREHTERLGYRVEVVLGFIAAASLAGVLQWTDAAFNVDARMWAWIEAGLLGLAAAIVVGIYVWAGRSR